MIKKYLAAVLLIVNCLNSTDKKKLSCFLKSKEVEKSFGYLFLKHYQNKTIPIKNETIPIKIDIDKDWPYFFNKANYKNGTITEQSFNKRLSNYIKSGKKIISSFGFNPVTEAMTFPWKVSFDSITIKNIIDAKADINELTLKKKLGQCNEEFSCLLNKIKKTYEEIIFNSDKDMTYYNGLSETYYINKQRFSEIKTPSGSDYSYVPSFFHTPIWVFIQKNAPKKYFDQKSIEKIQRLIEYKADINRIFFEMSSNCMHAPTNILKYWTARHTVSDDLIKLLIDSKANLDYSIGSTGDFVRRKGEELAIGDKLFVAISKKDSDQRNFFTTLSSYLYQNRTWVDRLFNIISFDKDNIKLMAPLLLSLKGDEELGCLVSDGDSYRYCQYVHKGHGRALQVFHKRFLETYLPIFFNTVLDEISDMKWERVTGFHETKGSYPRGNKVSIPKPIRKLIIGFLENEITNKIYIDLMQSLHSQKSKRDYKKMMINLVPNK